MNLLQTIQAKVVDKFFRVKFQKYHISLIKLNGFSGTAWRRQFVTFHKFRKNSGFDLW